MKILSIALHFSEYAYCLAKELSRTNKVILVVTNINANNELEGANISSTENLEIVYLEHKKNLKTLFANTLDIFRLASKFNPDIVHLQEVAHEYQTAAMFLLRKRPLVLTVHDPVPHMGEDMKSFNSFWGRRMLYSRLQRKMADSLITHGEFLCDKLKAITDKPNKVFSVHHGPLGLLFDAADQTPAGNVFAFLFFGRMQKYKGIEFFINAVDLLKNEGLNVQGILAGKGPELTEAKSSIAGKQHFIIKDYFLSPKEVASTFDESDVVVIPYVEGTQSGVAALAIGRGKPCIITRVGSLPEMVVDCQTGFVIEPNNLEHLLTAMRALYNDKKQCTEMGGRARKFGQSEKSWNAAATKTLELYSQAIDTRN